MPTHFNAFISYRHCAPDAEVAGRIQRQLEHYRIPKAIQKATGIKKIDRIFRDKEELPLSGNLGDDIEYALRNSDYLIVICSPRFSESTWCQREIALFLQDHPIDHILTVLVEGEPQDVVPEVLRTGREPLSCDFRMSPRKAKEIELPRLAAAILGCRYDDLRQRAKQYKARRRTAFASAAMIFLACLSVYYYRTSRQIQQNYVQSLQNQSMFLASESLELLDDSDRLTAIALALEALPQSEDDPRPWLPEAEYALSRAVNAYGSIEDVLAINAFRHENTVYDFFLSPEGDILVSWDEGNQIYVWDTQTFALLRSFSAGVDLDYTPVLPMPDGRMLIGGSDGAMAFSYLTGEKLWENRDVYCFDLILSKDGSFAVTSQTYGTPMAVLDTATGRVMQTPEFPPEIADSFSTLTPLALSPDGRYLAMQFGSFQDYRVLVYDLEAGSVAISEFSMCDIQKIAFTQAGNVLVAGHKDKSSNYSSSLMGLNFTSTTQMQMDVFCLDAVSAGILWSNSFHYYLAGFDTALISATQETEGGQLQEVACVSAANVCILYDAATGQQLQRLEMPASAVSFDYQEGRLLWFLVDGSYASYRLGATSVGAIRYFPEDVIRGKANHGSFVQTNNSNRILLFRSTRDDSWAGFENEVPIRYSYGTAAVSDTYLVIKADYRNTYNCYDLTGRRFLQALNIDESAGQSILGFAPDGNTLVIGDSTTKSIVSMNLSTGESAKSDLPCTPAEGFNAAEILSGSIFLEGGRIGYTVSSWSETSSTLADGSITVTLGKERCYQLCIWNPEDGSLTAAVIPGEFEAYSPAPAFCVSPDGSHALVTVRRTDENYNSIYEAYLLELSSGNTSPITEMAFGEYGELPALAWSSDSRMLAVVSTDGIRIWDTLGNLQTTILPDSKAPLSVCFDPDCLNLLVICSDSKVYRYSVYGGLLNKFELYFYDTGLSQYTDFSWRFTDQGLLIGADDVCTLVNTSLWAPYSYVQNYLHYDKASDCFCVSINTQDGVVLGSYQRLSTAALIEKATEILGENTLTQDQRNQYGLD